MAFEALEPRQLLSLGSAARINVELATGPGGVPLTGSASPPSSAFTPSQIRTAYGISSISLGGVSGTGSGQTIAIVDAYNDPNIVSDVAAFNTYYSLQQFNVTGGPTLTLLNENGGTSLPASSTGWAAEIALDVEWAHVVAPQANIILFEANSGVIVNNDGSAGDMLIAVQTAAAFDKTINGVLNNVSVVSMSWGGGEFSTEASYDSYFTAPSGHANVTFLAATGDDGSPGLYPAYSPNVVAVGGTSLYLNLNP